MSVPLSRGSPWPRTTGPGRPRRASGKFQGRQTLACCQTMKPFFCRRTTQVREPVTQLCRRHPAATFTIRRTIDHSATYRRVLPKPAVIQIGSGSCPLSLSSDDKDIAPVHWEEKRGADCARKKSQIKKKVL
ncbi:hypothetical protein MRX96_027106 [Rhipicephalus microplus]